MQIPQDIPDMAQLLLGTRPQLYVSPMAQDPVQAEESNPLLRLLQLPNTPQRSHLLAQIALRLPAQPGPSLT